MSQLQSIGLAMVLCPGYGPLSWFWSSVLFMVSCPGYRPMYYSCSLVVNRDLYPFYGLLSCLRSSVLVMVLCPGYGPLSWFWSSVLVMVVCPVMLSNCRLFAEANSHLCLPLQIVSTCGVIMPYNVQAQTHRLTQPRI
jgi:hypothetical protein